MRVLFLIAAGVALSALSGCRAPGSGFFSTERSRAQATEEIRQLEKQQLDQAPVMRGRRVLPLPVVEEK